MATNFGDLRTRINLDFEVNSQINAVIVLQDGRVMGEVVDGYHTSGSLHGSNRVDAHQAYIQINDLFLKGIDLRVGRFEHAIANERLYGRSDWDLVSRSFDGVILSESTPWVSFEQVALKIRDNRVNRGKTIYGLRAVMPGIYLEPYIMYDNDRWPIRVNEETNDLLHRTSAGIYHRHVHGEFDWEAQAIYQFGEQVIDHIDWRIDASLLAAEIGYSSGGELPARVATGFDWSTGMTDSSFHMARWIEDPYKSSDLSRGRFQLFTDTQPYGLFDIYGEVQARIGTSGVVSMEYHHFETTRPRFSSILKFDPELGISRPYTIGPSKRMGSEIDIAGEYAYLKGVKFGATGSVFFPSEYMVSPIFPYVGVADPSPIYRLYTTLTVDF